MKYFSMFSLRNQVAAITIATLAPLESAAERPADDYRCSFVDPVYDIPRLWGFMAAFDFDERVVNPAIIDIGILNDGSTRSGGERCNVSYQFSQFAPANFTCDASFGGNYSGILPNRTTHGNNMKNILAATLNDGGWAGLAGQVSTPLLYRFDEVHNYVFELDATIDRAVSAGATSINISGGFPCTWKPSFSPTSTFDLCTIEGRIAAATPLCTVPSPGPDSIAQSIFCIASAGSVISEGDIRDRINGAAAKALLAGIPIVSSAGNVESDLTGLLSGATAPNANTLTWGILPATSPSVISVGAVDPNPPYGNFDFHGSDVDLWAPQNDTSPAAAFVSGLVALAQAINPELNPETASLVPSISVALRDHLINSAFTNADLDAAGHVDPTGLRGNLVNPYGFIRAVSDGLVPDYRALGYPEHFDSWVEEPFSGSDGRPSDCNAVQVENDVSDDETTPFVIPVPLNGTSNYGGTILFYDGPVQIVDEDWYALSYHGLASAGHHATSLELRYPAGFGSLELVSPEELLRLESTSVDGEEEVKRYVTERIFGGAELIFKVAGTSPRQDNLYRLTVSQDQPVFTKPDSFDVAGTNDQATTATKVTPDAIPTGVTVETINGIDIEFGNASIHRLSDSDNYLIEGFRFPEGDLLAGIKFSVDAHSRDVDVFIRTASNGHIASGRGSATGVRPIGEPFRIEVVSRYPGLFASYRLTATLAREPTSPHGSAAMQEAELAAFIEQLETRLPRAELPPEVGCVACNTMRERGILKADKPRIEGRTRRQIISKFLLLGEASQLVLNDVDELESRSVTVLDKNMREVPRKISPDSLIFSLEPGPHIVQWKSTGRAKVIEYVVRLR